MIIGYPSEGYSGVNPRDWTRNGAHLGGLSGLIVFELLRALVTERGMYALAIVDLLDETRK